MVQGAEAYNDSITDAFRRQAVRMAATSRKERNISLAYIDLGTQRQFIDSFPRRKGRKRRCENGHGPRDVSIKVMCAVVLKVGGGGGDSLAKSLFHCSKRNTSVNCFKPSHMTFKP